MGQVDLNFKPSVDVFDANVALGRRHDRRVNVDTAKGTLKEMDRAGIGRALVYAPHAATYDSQDGNRLLVNTIAGEPRLVPQFVCHPGFDDLESFGAQVKEAGVRSVRMFPKLHNYPFRDWVVDPWLRWLEQEGIPVWLPVDHDLKGSNEIDPRDVYDTVSERPDLIVVLSEVRYTDFPWAIPLLRHLPNLHVEVSRFVLAGGIESLLGAVGEERILFGSRFPESAMAPQLYSIHRSGLSAEALVLVCAGNLDRLLGRGKP